MESRNLGLDFIRFTAILLVLVSHYNKSLEILGFWGVELFFGLSGYLIGIILWRGFIRSSNWGTKNVINFWARRWWRTLPNYLLFLLVSFPYHIFIIQSKIPSISNLLPFFVFSQNMFSRDGVFYGVSWSLCVEEWLYLLFPIILFLFHKIFRAKSTAFGLTLSFFVIVSIIMRILIKNQGQVDIRTITSCRLDSIAYGIAIAYIESNWGIKNTQKTLFAWFGILLMISPLIVKTITHVSFDELRQNQLLLISVPLGSSLILPFVGNYARFNNLNIKLKKIITNLSIWTYSIYLSHIPILFTVYLLFTRFRGNSFLNLISKVVAFFLTILISSLIYKYFEKPFTRKRPKEIIDNDYPATVNI